MHIIVNIGLFVYCSFGLRGPIRRDTAGQRFLSAFCDLMEEPLMF